MLIVYLMYIIFGNSNASGTVDMSPHCVFQWTVGGATGRSGRTTTNAALCVVGAARTSGQFEDVTNPNLPTVVRTVTGLTARTRQWPATQTRVEVRHQ